MSRFRQLIHSLASAYVLLAVNAVCSFAMLPLALSFLDDREFGLWSLVAQLNAYVFVIELGMAAAARIFIEYKDQRHNGVLGSVLQSYLVIGAVQGVAALAVATGIGMFGAGLSGVPDDLRIQFQWLMVAQGVMFLVNFFGRGFSFLLVANHQQTVLNLIQTATVIGQFGIFCVGLRSGQGVYSAAIALISMSLAANIAYLVFCRRLQLLPVRGAWGRASWARFRELFSFGWHTMFYAVGLLVVPTLQALLVSRMIDIASVGVFAACTKAYGLLIVVSIRVLDMASPTIAELIIRGDRPRVLQWFRSVYSLTSCIVVIGAVGLTVANQSFVTVWTKGQMQWAPVNDLWLGLFLLVTMLTRTHTALVVQTRAIGTLRFVYYVEGVVFLMLALPLVRVGGITALLMASVGASLMVTVPYGLWRTRQYFGLSWRTILLGWHASILGFLCAVGLVAAGAWWLTRDWTPLAAFLLRGFTVVIAGGLLALTIGLNSQTRSGLARRLPPWAGPVRRLLTLLPGRATQPVAGPG